MSLSKELCLRSDSQNSDSFSDCFCHKFQSKEDNYRRNSFSDRFCDDLCEDILQYLSLEDKHRLEFVSKQFQRTVFIRQYELFINMRGPEAHKLYLNYKDLKAKSYYQNYYYIEDRSLDSFKSLLKKCPNITSINFDGHQRHNRDYNPDKINAIYRLIIENCNNLRDVMVFKDINDSNFEEFYQKFWAKIKHLPTFRELIDLNLFPNIEKIKITDRDDYSIIPQLKLDNLKQLDLDFQLVEENLLQKVIDTFPTLTHLNVYFVGEKKNAIYKSLENISNLKHLIHFCFYVEFLESNKLFCGLLEQMSNICQNLMSIECCFVINNNFDLSQLFSQLKAFPALKRLNLRLRSANNVNVYQLFSFELFKGFSNITHLSLCFNWRKILKESILKEIDIHLPKLQYLQIEYRFNSTPEEVTQMADILSRLSRLETLKMKFKSGVDFKPIEEEITKKCRKIRKIQISNI